jgi:hypothetical protein
MLFIQLKCLEIVPKMIQDGFFFTRKGDQNSVDAKEYPIPK